MSLGPAPGGLGTLTLATERPMSAAALDGFLGRLVDLAGANLLQVTGLVRLADDPARPAALRGANGVIEPPVRRGSWPGADRRTRLTLVGRQLPAAEIRELFRAFAGETAPDRPDAAALLDNPLAIPGRRLR